jgi:CheY-like chemotaxis protein
MEPRGTILLVCVGDMPRMLLANYLEGLGYEVHSAGDPVEALGILTRAEIELAISLQVSPGEPFLFRTLEDGGINIPVLSLEPHDAGELPQRPGAAATLAWPAPRPEVAATVERLLSRVRAARYATAVHQRRAATDGGPATVPVREQDVERIGRYRVEELIGRGSMGEVFRCRDEIMGRLVAVKTMSYEIGSGVEKSFADRFMVEAGSLARLVHPGIVATHDFGIDQRRKKMFLVMEYVDGPTLLHEMKKGQMAIEIALRIGWDMADALAHAHERDVVHRDVKPGNVMLDAIGQPKLTDFGLARLGSFSVSDGKMVVGSPSYMAPETVLRPASADHRVDQYSLGVVLFEMITGWETELSGTITYQVLAGLNVKRPSLKELGIAAPPEVQQLLSCLTARIPNNRFEDDKDLLDAFAEAGRKVGLQLERAM